MYIDSGILLNVWMLETTLWSEQTLDQRIWGYSDIGEARAKESHAGYFSSSTN